MVRASGTRLFEPQVVNLSIMEGSSQDRRMDCIPMLASMSPGSTTLIQVRMCFL